MPARPAAARSDVPELRLEGVEAAYDGIIVALHGVTLEVPAGGLVVLLGANGAGKTTTLKAAAGLLRPERGRVTAGRVLLRGRDVTEAPPGTFAAEGVALVLEGRHCFRHLTVEENLVAGALVRAPSRAALRRDLDRVYQRFGRLAGRRSAVVGRLSGGEQQLVALGRALMGAPRLVLLDEPSMGLAPQLVEETFRLVQALHREEGVAFLVAEQNAALALRHAQYAYVLENGRVGAAGPAAELARLPLVRRLYLGEGLEAAAAPA